MVTERGWESMDLSSQVEILTGKRIGKIITSPSKIHLITRLAYLVGLFLILGLSSQVEILTSKRIGKIITCPKIHLTTRLACLVRLFLFSHLVLLKLLSSL